MEGSLSCTRMSITRSLIDPFVSNVILFLNHHPSRLNPQDSSKRFLRRRHTSSWEETCISSESREVMPKVKCSITWHYSSETRKPSQQKQCQEIQMKDPHTTVYFFLFFVKENRKQGKQQPYDNLSRSITTQWIRNYSWGNTPMISSWLRHTKLIRTWQDNMATRELRKLRLPRQQFPILIKHETLTVDYVELLSRTSQLHCFSLSKDDMELRRNLTSTRTLRQKMRIMITFFICRNSRTATERLGSRTGREEQMELLLWSNNH